MEEKFNEGTIQRTFYEIEEPLPFECLVLDHIKAENEVKYKCVWVCVYVFSMFVVHFHRTIKSHKSFLYHL